MPNYVINKVRFQCGEEKLKEILAAIQYDNDGTRDYSGPGTIDFNKLIPMPEALQIECGSNTDHGIELYLTSVNPNSQYPNTEKMTPDAFDDLLQRLNRSRLLGSYHGSLSADEIRKMTEHTASESLMELGRKAVDNLLNYGATTWYDWSWDHWNTKWNACACSYSGGDTIVFETAWDPPHPILEELTVRFPGVYITHQWADEDLGSNCGQREYLNGECVGEFFPETEKEALELALDLWEYTPEDIDLTLNAAQTRYISTESPEYEVIELFDKVMLFSNERLSNEDIPAGLYRYDLRMSDDGSRFCSLEPSVCVNHGGTVITDEPIDFGDRGYIELDDETDPNFIGSHISFGQYMRGEYEQEEQEDMNLE